LKALAIYELEGGEVRCFHDDGWGLAGLEGFLPSLGAEAPAVAGLETGEVILEARRGEVVASLFGEGEKFGRHHGADSVNAAVIGTEPAVAIAHEPSHGIHSAGFQRFAEDVTLFAHGDGVAEGLADDKNEAGASRVGSSLGLVASGGKIFEWKE
jgi:hypothetical protein